MPFTDISEFSQGIEGIRKQAQAMLESGDAQQVRSAKKMLCKYDLKYLCMNYLGCPDWDTVHDDIQACLDTIKSNAKERQYRLFLIPRGHLKSSIVTKGWAVQQILRNPNVRILIANAIWDNARGFARTMMSYLEGGFTDLPKIFGDFKPKGRSAYKWSADAFTVASRTIPMDAATITTAGVERTQTSQHYDIIILDDLVARENVTTKEQREKVKNYYKDCLSLLEPNGIVIVVGTTWHEDDLYSAVDDENPGLIHDKDFQPVFIRQAEKGTEESVLFKKKFNLNMLMNIKKKQGPFLYSAQYLLNPYPEEDMTFAKGWIKPWRFESEMGIQGRILSAREPLYISMTIDPSLGKEKSDYAAMVTVGVNKDEEKFILEAKRFKRKMEFIPEEVIKTLKYMEKIGFGVNVIGLESFGFQQSLLNPIKEAVVNAGFKTRVELLPAVNNKACSKETRIESLIPDFSSYSIYIHPSQRELIDELLRFNPNTKNKSDDIIDALAWNKMYWGRKPNEVIKKKDVYGSFKWYVDQMLKVDTMDLFQEYR